MNQIQFLLIHSKVPDEYYFLYLRHCSGGVSIIYYKTQKLITKNNGLIREKYTVENATAAHCSVCNKELLSSDHNKAILSIASLSGVQGIINFLQSLGIEQTYII